VSRAGRGCIEGSSGPLEVRGLVLSRGAGWPMLTVVLMICRRAAAESLFTRHITYLLSSASNAWTHGSIRQLGCLLIKSQGGAKHRAVVFSAAAITRLTRCQYSHHPDYVAVNKTSQQSGNGIMDDAVTIPQSSRRESLGQPCRYHSIYGHVLQYSAADLH
jgi:hypothetical protein